MKTQFALASLLALSVTACGGSSSNSDKASESTTPVATPVAATEGTGDTAPVETAPEVAVPVTTEINANLAEGGYLDLDTLKVVEATDAGWDLSFKKTTVKLNADVSGLQATETFDAIATAPATGYRVDTDGVTATDKSGFLFHQAQGWYTYDMATHTISSNDLVYVIKSNAGSYFKVTITSYYNVDKISGYVQLKSQKIAAPAVAE